MYKFEYYPLYDEFNEDGGDSLDVPEPANDNEPIEDTPEIDEGPPADDTPKDSEESLTEQPPVDDTPNESDELKYPEPANDNNPVKETPEIEEENPAGNDSTEESTDGEESLTENQEGERIQDASDWDSLSDQEKINRLRGIDDSAESEQELTEEGNDNITEQESYDGGDGVPAVADDKLEPENIDDLDQRDRVDAKDDYDVHRYGMREGEDMYGDDKSYGNSGDPTRDSLDANATYEDSHYNETDYFYKDEQAEETERANLEGRANLKRQNEIDEERAEEEEQEQEEREREEEELAEQQRQEEETKEQQERSLQDIIREKRGISSNSDSTSVEKRNINPYMRYRGRDGR